MLRRERRKQKKKQNSLLFSLSFHLFSLLPQLAHRRLGGLRLLPRPRRHGHRLLPQTRQEERRRDGDDGDGNNFVAPVFVLGLRRRGALLLRVRALRLVLPEARERRRRAVQDRVRVAGTVRREESGFLLF